METPEQRVKFVQSLYNDTKMSFWCFSLLTSVSIVDFEQVNAVWELGKTKIFIVAMKSD